MTNRSPDNLAPTSSLMPSPTTLPHFPLQLYRVPCSCLWTSVLAYLPLFLGCFPSSVSTWFPPSFFRTLFKCQLCSGSSGILSPHLFIFFSTALTIINGNLLQYSCLENPMDKGAWRATVHEVTRVGHDLVTKPPPIHLFKVLKFGLSLLG